MSEPTKIRATQQGEVTDIRMLMQHAMETGLRKDPADGHAVPAHFIQQFTISANGRPLIEAQTNTSIARNPLFSFRVKGLKVGDRISVSWIDSKGDRRSDEVTVGSA